MDPACRIDRPADIERTYPRQARTPFNVTGHPALAMMAGLSSGRPAALGAVRRPLFRRGDAVPGGARLGAGVRRRQEASADRVRAVIQATRRLSSKRHVGRVVPTRAPPTALLDTVFGKAVRFAQQEGRWPSFASGGRHVSTGSSATSHGGRPRRRRPCAAALRHRTGRQPAGDLHRRPAGRDQRQSRDRARALQCRRARADADLREPHRPQPAGQARAGSGAGRELAAHRRAHGRACPCARA